MLEVVDLFSSYGRVAAVRGLSLAAMPGRITLLLGANGAGKTTTLRTIAGLHKPVSGEVRLRGRRVDGLPAAQLVEAGIALVPEGRRVFAPLTVHENLLLGAYTAPKESVVPTLAKVYDRFPILSDRRDGAAGLLSGGEQQMLAFGRALMSQPKVMLMDEPSMGLAPAVVDTVLGMVRDIANSDIAVLIVEQNAEVGLEIADDVVVMTRGEVVFDGLAGAARSNPVIVRTFLGEVAFDSTVEPTGL